MAQLALAACCSCWSTRAPATAAVTAGSVRRKLLPRASLAQQGWEGRLRLRPRKCRLSGIAAGDGGEPPAEGQEEVATNQALRAVEMQFSKTFGGLLWFGVLAFSLAIFAGAYVYLIYNYADLSSIPILRGPQEM